MLFLLGGVFGLLVCAAVAGFILSRTVRSEKARSTIENLNSRIRSWWVMCLVFLTALLTGGVCSVILFAVVSFLALREFITITPTRPCDHGVLFLVFFVLTPVQYYLVYVRWYGLFAIFIPVYAFMLIPIRGVLGGDSRRFFEKTAKIQWALMICVYCVSHAPALLSMSIRGFEGRNAKLLFFLVLVVEMSDVLQYLWGKAVGRHGIAPGISPNKTWEGFVGGTLTATALGTALWWITPFSPLQAGLISLLLVLAGFGGDLTMSAIKRDCGIKDYGECISGHGGMMDRIDSLCFAAPLFFHITRFFFAEPVSPTWFPS